MLPELKKISIVVLATAFAGSILGVLIGALTEEYLLWVGVSGVLGAGFGLVLAYGFLPES